MMKLELKNIGGLVGTHEYDLQPGVNRITGPSASGKSSILRGIECLVTDDNDLLRRTLNDDNEVGYVKFGDYERNLQRVDAKIVKASIDDKTFYEKKSEWGYADDIVFFTPESNVVKEIENGNFDVCRYIERISKAEDISRDIFRKEQQLDGKKKELEQYIDNLTHAQKLESDIEKLEGDIEELLEKEAELEKAVEKETGSKDLKIIAMDIARLKQDIRGRDERLRRREGDVKLYMDKYETTKSSYERLDAVIRKLEKWYQNSEYTSKDTSKSDDMLSDSDKNTRSGHAGIDGRYSQEDIFGGIDLNDIFGGGGGYGGHIFDHIFGGGERGRRRGPTRGSDLRHDMEIEFMDAAHGKETTITIPREENCDTCKGSGAKEGTSPKTCPACKGSGQVTQVRRTPLGNLAQCSTCCGEGKIVDNPCTNCHGSGKVHKTRKTRNISVKIPAGVHTGSHLRVSWGSEAEPSGDLYVVLHVKAHKFFERFGDDIMFELPLTSPQLTLGCEVEVPTLGDKVKMKIPAGTQVGSIFRLKGRGMTKLHWHGNGDLRVRVGVVEPTEQKILLHGMGIKIMDAAFETEVKDNILKFDYSEIESQRDAIKDDVRGHEDKKAQLKSEKDEVDKILGLVESAYILGVSPIDEKPISLELLDEKKKDLRCRGADLASKIKFEEEQIKYIKVEFDEVNKNINKLANLRRDGDRIRDEMNAAKKELDQRQNLTVDIDVEITALGNELNVLQKDYGEVSNSLKSGGKEKLKSIQMKIGGFENEIKNKKSEVDNLTGSIPDYIIGESLKDYTNKKSSGLEKLRNEIVALKEQYNKAMFGAIYRFNTSIQDIYNSFGFKGLKMIEIVKKMKRDELSSLDIIIHHKDGTDKSIETLSKTEQLILGLALQIAAKDNYMPDFPFFVMDDIINEYQDIYEGVLKYLSGKAEYVIISQNVPYSKQKEIIIKHGIA